VQFHAMYADVGFSFRDPLTATGVFYACLWLFLGMAIFVINNRLSLVRAFTTVGIYVLGGLFLPKTVLLALLNITARPGVHIGMPWGGPPLWLSLTAVTSGLSLGWVLLKVKRRKGLPINLADDANQDSSERRSKRLKAVLLGIVFPGLGQVYKGQYVIGFLVFFYLACLTYMFKLIGFLLVYVPALVACAYQRDANNTNLSPSGKNGKS